MVSGPRGARAVLEALGDSRYGRCCLAWLDLILLERSGTPGGVDVLPGSTDRVLVVCSDALRGAAVAGALSQAGREIARLDDLPAAVGALSGADLPAVVLDVEAAAAHPALLPALAARPPACALLVLYAADQSRSVVEASERATPDGLLAYAGAGGEQGWSALLGAALERASTCRRRQAEHQRMARRFDEVQRWLDGALAAARMGYLDWDLRTDAIVMSDEIYRLYGLRKDQVDTVDDLLQEAVHPDDLDRVREALGRAARGEQRCDIEHRIVRPDGSVLWIAAGAELERGADGAPTRLFGVARDITERREQQAQIERLGRVHRLLSQVNQAVVRADDEARLLARACSISVEQAGYRMAWIGLLDEPAARVRVAASHGQIGDYLDHVDIRLDGTSRSRGPTGRAVTDRKVVACNDIATDPAMAPWRERALSQGYRASVALPMIAGERLWGVLNLYAGEAGAFDGHEIDLLEELAADLGFALSHLAERRQRGRAERALACRVAQQQAVADLGRRALAGEPLGALMTQAAEALSRCLEVELTKVLELRRSGELGLVAGVGWRPGLVGHAVVGAGIESQAGYTLRHHEPVVVEDLATEARFSGPELLTSHGVTAGLSVIIGASEAPWGVLGAHSRARRQFEAHDVAFMQAMADVLGQSIARRQAEAQLQRAQRLEAVGRLAGGVAHDFNNLLTVVMGATEELRARITDDAAVLEEIDIVARSADRAAALTRQLLAFSRRQPQRPRGLDLNEVVGAVSTLLRRTVGEDVSLEVALDPEPCPVVADVAQLEQVLMNLAVNARDAMPDGGTLRIATRRERRAAVEGEIPSAGADDALWVVLEVSDTGQGMDEEVRFMAFEPFFTTKAVGQGSGLGLSTVCGIVEQSGGQLRLDTAPGKGARFQIYLPVGQADAPSEAPSATARDDRGAGETVLLVEDDAGVRHTTRRILARYGYRVLEADCAAAALAELTARHGEIDLLLSDVVMPAMSGVELRAEVRRRWPAVRPLLMSGYAERAIQGEPGEGAQLLLAKPFSAGELVDAVRSVLDEGKRDS